METHFKILHVDDDEDHIELFGLMFGSKLNIIPSTNFETTVKLLEKNRFDALITDYDMPDITGLDLLKHVKKSYPHLPVIFYTGQENEEVAREAFISGASDYFIKDLSTFAQKERLINSIKNASGKIRAERDKSVSIQVLERLNRPGSSREMYRTFSILSNTTLALKPSVSA